MIKCKLILVPRLGRIYKNKNKSIGEQRGRKRVTTDLRGLKLPN